MLVFQAAMFNMKPFIFNRDRSSLQITAILSADLLQHRPSLWLRLLFANGR